jgi:hypothetical protein
MLKTSYTSAQYLNEANSLTYAYGKINAVVIADIDGNGFTDLVTFPSNFTVYPELQPLVWSNTNDAITTLQKAVEERLVDVPDLSKT